MPGLGRQPGRGRARRCCGSSRSATRTRRATPPRPPAAGWQAVEIDLPAAPSGAARGRARRSGAWRDLRGLLLGFDGDRRGPQARCCRATWPPAPSSAPGRLPGEVELLTVFADLSELSRNRPDRDLLEAEPDSAVHSPREYFHSYLRSLDVERAGLPEAFQARLRRVLGHYGVTSLDRTPELETAVFRIFLAQQRMTADAGDRLRAAAAVAGERAARRAAARAGRAGARAPHRGHPAALPRRVRPRPRRGVPLVRPAAAAPQPRQGLRRGPRATCATWTATRTRRTARSGSRRWWPARSRWSGCSASGSAAAARDHAPLLEVLTRRYYGNRAARRRHRARRRRAAGSSPPSTTAPATAVTPGGRRPPRSPARGPAAAPSTACRDLAAAAPAGGLVADLYVTWRRDQPDGRDALAAAHRRPARAAAAPAAGQRRAGHRHGRRQPAAPPCSTTSPSGRPPAHGAGDRGAGLAEDRLIRGLHPQIAERLQLDRLREFDLTRLPSADEEIYLFKAVAKSNKADERLVAMGQVRDLTPLREADGRLVALPALENVLAGCLDAIRTIQAQRPQHKRFDTNRIMIYVWPAVDLTVEEINSLVHRIRPTTSGAGLEEVQFVARHAHPVGGAGRGRGVDQPRRQPQRAAAHGAAADRAAPAARRLPAEGAARRPARQRVPVRADRPAGRARTARSPSTTWTTPARWCR